MNLRTFRLKIKDALRIRNRFIRECLAEFLGTFLLLVFGIGSVAQSVLSHEEAGSHLTIYIGWGLGVTMGVWLAGGVSGAHLNPAVSFTMVVLGRLPSYKLPFYWLAQYLGGFTSAACVFGTYYDAINAYDGGVRCVTCENNTAAIFATYPQPYLSILGGFFDQVFGTMLLLLCIMALTDENNMAPPRGLIPLSVGMVVLSVGMTYGFNCGYAINPARDLGPRFFTFVAGWGEEVFTAYDNWSWVPVVAPHIGAVLGAWVYLLFVGIHNQPPRNSETGDISKTNLTKGNDHLEIYPS